MATTMLKIKSHVNGLEQEVSQETYDVLVKQGYNGKILKTIEPVKTAKAPEEVTKK